jgi:hypothetical protein
VSRNKSVAAGWRGAFALAVVTAAIFSFSATAQSSDRPQGRGFLGLWEGIDPLDGSTVQLSISNVDNDDILEILWGESFFTVCFELGPDYSLGRGLIAAEGRLVDPSLLEVEGIPTCINDVNAPDATEEFLVNFILYDHLLVISSGNIEFPDIRLHRVAR